MRSTTTRLAIASLALAVVPATPADAETLYVSAAAGSAGDGSRAQPFASLARVERASRPGDTIVVLPSPGSAAPLAGGIALKRDQSLVGAGPSVRGASLPQRVPALTNTDAARHSGDAVTLADGSSVRNIVVADAYRGAIYGEDVTGVDVRGNNVFGHNTSCAEGFHIQPFLLPSMLPGVGVPISEGLINGWAGIMVDADRARGKVTIARNRVHDSHCGDGIDVRLAGTARIDAEIRGNFVTDLEEGEDLQSVLAVGMQALGRSSLNARLDRNRQFRIGNIELPPEGPLNDLGNGLPGVAADSEGVFANLDDHARFDAVVTRNTFREGIGGFSANGMEMVITDGSPTAHMRISDSSFTDVPGDILEAINFGTGSTMSLTLDHVVASHSTGIGNTYVIPGNNGDCLVLGQSGAGSSTKLVMRDSVFSDCVNNGMLAGSNVVSGGPAAALELSISDSVISGNRGYGVRVGALTALQRLRARFENTTITGNAGVANLAFDDLGGTTDAIIDAGGGALGSSGGNCIFGGAVLDTESIGFDVSAAGNWWGQAGGPLPGRTLGVGGTIDATSPLSSAPRAGC